MNTGAHEGRVLDSLRDFIEACKQIDRWVLIEDADWNEEIGALLEACAEQITSPPLIIFDRVKGYPAGYRIASNVTSSYKRQALALGLPVDGKSREELSQLAREKMRNLRFLPPVEVAKGPVMENVLTGDAVDLFRFPSPRYHASDGGRYLGTGYGLLNRDPDSGYVNMGTYRLQVHERDLFGLWMSPGQQGRTICQKHWDEGKSCPVVAVFGIHPLLLMGSSHKFPWGTCELDYVGGLKGEPVEVIKGPITGLPIPAYAEIAVEGEVPPPGIQARDEGPFGEWPGYYSGGTIGTGEPQPVVRVKAVYYRTNPIILGQAPTWPGASEGLASRGRGLNVGEGRGGLRDLRAAGIQDVVGVGNLMRYIRVIAIRQRYPGHAKQAAHAALAATRNGRWIVVVDEDIDPTDLQEVLWAMTTRCDPAKDIEVVEGVWSTPLDPLVSASPEKIAARDHTNSVAIYYAVRPFHRKDRFPRVSRSPRELRRRVVEKYRSVLPFPD